MSGRLLPATQRKAILPDDDLAVLEWGLPDKPVPVDPSDEYVRVGCIGDGSCFFHAFAKALASSYKKTYYTYAKVSEATLREWEIGSRGQVIFGDELFTTPRRPNPDAEYTIASDEFYDLLHKYRSISVRLLREDIARRILGSDKMRCIIWHRLRGSIELHLDKAGTLDKAYDMLVDELVSELRSNMAVKPDIMLLLSDYLDIDVYLLRDVDLKNGSCPLYGGASLHSAVQGPESDRRAIVIISIDDIHYELVARVDKDNVYHPVFTQEEPLVRRLYEMLLEWR